MHSSHAAIGWQGRPTADLKMGLLPIEWVIFSSFWCFGLRINKKLGVIQREVESGEILADTVKMSAARRAKSRSDRSSLWITPLLYPLSARFGLFLFGKPGSYPQPRCSPAPWGASPRGYG